MIELNRHKLFGITFLLIISTFLLIKINFISQAKFTTGRMIGMKEVKSLKTSNYVPQIVYSANGKSYELEGTDNVDYGTEWLPIIYNPKKPETAFVFDFIGFWYFGMLMSIFFILLSAAFIYGLMEKKTKLKIKFSQKKIQS